MDSLQILRCAENNLQNARFTSNLQKYGYVDMDDLGERKAGLVNKGLVRKIRMLGANPIQEAGSCSIHQAHLWLVLIKRIEMAHLQAQKSGTFNANIQSRGKKSICCVLTKIVSSTLYFYMKTRVIFQ